jgi:hypothetical protein
VRNADDGVRVRLYEQTIDKGTPPPGACVPTAFLQAEVSDDQNAGTGGGVEWAAPTTAALDPLGAQVVGSGEPQPILTVVSHTGSGVATVTLTTPDGSDHATPTGGWVALAVQLPAATDTVPSGTLTATAADGSTLATVQLDTVSAGKTPPCMPVSPACLKANASSSGGVSTSSSGTSAAGPETNMTCQCKMSIASAGTSGPDGTTGATGASGTSGSTATCDVTSGQASIPPDATTTTSAK